MDPGVYIRILHRFKFFLILRIQRLYLLQRYAFIDKHKRFEKYLYLSPALNEQLCLCKTILQINDLFNLIVTFILC